MKKLLKIIILILIANYSFGQQFTDLYGDYLGQTLPGDTPVVFAPDIVSKHSLEHSAAVFSADGNEVYWCAIELPLNTNRKKIWFMQRENNRWTIPQPLDLFRDSSQVDIDAPFLSLDNTKLYFISERNRIPKQDVTSKDWMRYVNQDIWYVEKVNQNWSKPKSISQVINTDDLQSSPSFSNEGTVYFLSYLEGVKSGCGIFRATFENGAYATPEPLPKGINSIAAQDWAPYIANDDSYLIFSSYRDGGFGNGDLYISFHNTDHDTWSIPINMGESINTGKQERFPSISPDGMYLFFTRPRKGTNQDVWWVKSDIINELKQKAEFE